MRQFPLPEDELIGLYREGWLLDSLAERYGTTRNTIRSRLLSLGIKLRSRAAQPRMTQHGYVQIFRPSHPMANASGYVKLHRLVMAEALGRMLLPSETVHHIDGNRLNNDPANLQLRRKNHGYGGRYECADCGSRNVHPVPLD